MTFTLVFASTSDASKRTVKIVEAIDIDIATAKGIDIANEDESMFLVRVEQTDMFDMFPGEVSEDELRRYHSDPEYRESLPCSECGKAGGCEHFPSEAAVKAANEIAKAPESEPSDFLDLYEDVIIEFGFAINSDGMDEWSAMSRDERDERIAAFSREVDAALKPLGVITPDEMIDGRQQRREQK